MINRGKASVHDWLGGRIRSSRTSYNRLEEMANSRVPDEDVLCHAPDC
jgi:hypothetical protein